MAITETAAQALARPHTGHVTAAPVRPPIREWFDDRAVLVELWRWLEERGEQPADPAYYIEKPQHWQLEYDQMRAEQASRT